MSQWLRRIAVEAFPTVVAVAAVGVVSALETDSAGHLAGQFVELHVEATSSRVRVAVAG